MTSLRSVPLWFAVVAFVPACLDGVETGGSSDDVERLVQAATAGWDCYSPEPGHPTAGEKTAFIEELKTYAREAEATWGTPAAALIAMAANESGFGFTRIGQFANNLFGWKWTSTEAAGGRGYYTLSCQPSWDPGKNYVKFADRRDAVMFIAMKLATLERYRDDTDRYIADVRAGVPVKTAVDRWIAGVQASGYNPYASYVTTTKNFMNNYMSPSATFSATWNTYQHSPVTGPVEDVWVAIDAPAAGATIAGTASLAASVGGGTVDTVKMLFRPDGGATWTTICSDSSPPYGCAWSTGVIADGLYQLAAEAWAAGVRKATGIVRVTVKNAAPMVSLTAPATGSTVSGLVALSASVSGASPTSVVFQTRPVGESAWYTLATDLAAPWTATWATDPWVSDGDYELRVEARAGSTPLAAAVSTVTVRNAISETWWVELTSPAQGAIVSGTVPLTAIAGGTVPDGITQVTFASRPVGAGAWYTLATDTAAPWSASWATDPWVSDGDYELRVEAYAGGAVVASKSIPVTVRNADTIAPAVTISSPAVGAVVGGDVALAASATDASGIARVDFYSDGGNYLIASDTTPPFGITWATDPGVKNGFQILVVRATDHAGNVGSASLTVTVDNPSGGITLANAVEATSPPLTTGGDAHWYGDTTWYFCGGDAARSGRIGHGQTSWMELTTSGNKTLSFRWRVSSEANYDFLELWIDGVRKNRISGNTNWALQSWWLGAGTHTVRFVYRKDGATSAGLDAGFIDCLSVQ